MSIPIRNWSTGEGTCSTDECWFVEGEVEQREIENAWEGPLGRVPLMEDMTEVEEQRKKCQSPKHILGRSECSRRRDRKIVKSA